MNMNDIIITYRTLQDESKVRNKIKRKYNYEVIPVPRQISVSCGIAYRVEHDEFDNISKIIKNMLKSKEISDLDIHFYEDLGENNYKIFDLD